MYIRFNGTWVTNDGTGATAPRAITPAASVRLSARNQVQPAQLLRAPATTPILRDNLLNTLDFTVARNFALLNPGGGSFTAQAGLFALTHASTLMVAGGPLLMVTGAPGDTPCVTQCLAAVLAAAPSIVLKGVRVETAYSFQCGLIAQIFPLLNKDGSFLYNKDGTVLTQK